MEKVTEATLHLEKVTEAMAKCNLSLEYLKVTEAMAKCNLSLNNSQKIFWSDWTIALTFQKIVQYFLALTGENRHWPNMITKWRKKPFLNKPISNTQYSSGSLLLWTSETYRLVLGRGNNLLAFFVLWESGMVLGIDISVYNRHIC